jgi:hypothetical protein
VRVSGINEAYSTFLVEQIAAAAAEDVEKRRPEARRRRNGYFWARPLQALPAPTSGTTTRPPTCPRPPRW